MDATFWSAAGVGVLLGLKHALEPDHVIAVSTAASQSKNLWRAALTGVFWGLGHSLTLFVVGVSLLLLKLEMPQTWALSLEFGVGIMLVGLGITTLRGRKTAVVHSHAHEHNGHVHAHHHAHTHQAKADDAAHSHDISYWRSAAIGVLHGMAGSAGMVVLTISVAGDIWQAALYILCFGIGTVAGMLVSTTAIGLPFVLTAGHSRVSGVLVKASGLVSLVFGFYYMYEVGIGEGLFRLLAS